MRSPLLKKNNFLSAGKRFLKYFTNNLKYKALNSITVIDAVIEFRAYVKAEISQACLLS